MEADPSVFLVGVGIAKPGWVWGTLDGVLERFGEERVVEGPLAEEGLTGISMGAAMMGMRPVLIHHRMDFVLLSINQIVNHAAHWHAMFGGQVNVPLVIRAAVGRGWGNGAQHTGSHHAMFARIPGLKTVVPSNPRDAKGLYLAAVEDNGPVIFIEHRWLYEDDAPVPDEYYVTPLGKAAVVRQGKDVTIAAIGPMVTESMKAAAALEESGVSAEIVDLRTLRPLDAETILNSVGKTGRLVVADSDWKECGVGSEVVALATENLFESLKAGPARVAWPGTSVPSGHVLEAQFYPGAQEIQKTALRVCEQNRPVDFIKNTIKPFEGPF